MTARKRRNSRREATAFMALHCVAVKLVQTQQENPVIHNIILFEHKTLLGGLTNSFHLECRPPGGLIEVFPEGR
jgi:hypothetical protein